MMTRRNAWRAVAAALILGLSVVACAPQATPTAAPAAPTTAPADTAAPAPTEAEPPAPTEAPSPTEAPVEQQTIRVWTWTWEPENNYVNGVVEKFEAEHPNIDVVYEHLPPFGEGAYGDQLTLSFASGEPPDVFFILNNQVGTYATRDLLRPIDDSALQAIGHDSLGSLQDLYLPGALEGWSYDGQFYGVPNEISVYVLYGNTEQLQEAGYDPDTVKLDTWEDLVEVSNATVQKDASGNFTRVGYRLGYISPSYVSQNLVMTLAQHGGSILSEDGTRCTLNEPEAVEAVDYLVWLSRGSGVTDPHFGTQEGGAWQADWAAGLSTFVATNPAAIIGYANADSSVYEKWRAYPLPHPAEAHPGNVAWGWGWVVPQASQHPEAAWQFIGALTADAAQALEISGFPQGTKQLLTSDTLAGIPAYSAYEASMEGMVFQPSHPRYDEILDVLQPNIQTLVYEGADVQSTLDETCSEIDSILQRP